MNMPSILVVDDEPDNFDVIEALLSNQGYRLDYVSCGQDAIDFLDTCKPDVILLDVMMPGLDGVSVCQHIKSKPKWKMIPVVMVTALTTKQDLARCLEAGANDFISKPVNSLELRARVQSMMRIKQQYDTIQEFSKLQRDTINTLGKNLNKGSGDTSGLPEAAKEQIGHILDLVGQLNSNLEGMDIPSIYERLELIEKSALELDNLSQNDASATVKTNESSSSAHSSGRNQQYLSSIAEAPAS